MKRLYTSPATNIDHSIDDIKSKTLNMRHCHDSYELLFVIKGCGRFLVEGSEFPMKPRTMILVRPFSYHCVEVEEGEYERYVINFTPSYMTREVRPLFDGLFGTSGDDSGIFYSPENISHAVVSVFDRFEYAQGLSDVDKETYVRLLISELILLLSATTKQFIIHDEVELGARVAKYINDYIDKDNSLDSLAKRFFVSKYYLCHVFKKYSGVSIHSYVNHKRVMYAKQLIESGETASGAAYKVGFGDYSAFYRAYVKILGAPPTSEAKRKFTKNLTEEVLDE